MHLLTSIPILLKVMACVIGAQGQLCKTEINAGYDGYNWP